MSAQQRLGLFLPHIPMIVSELIHALELMDPRALVLADSAPVRCFSITRIDHVDQVVMLHSTMADGSPDGERISPEEPMVSEVSIHSKDHKDSKALGEAMAKAFENEKAIPMKDWLAARTAYKTMQDLMKEVSEHKLADDTPDYRYGTPKHVN